MNYLSSVRLFALAMLLVMMCIPGRSIADDLVTWHQGMDDLLAELFQVSGDIGGLNQASKLTQRDAEIAMRQRLEIGAVISIGMSESDVRTICGELKCDRNSVAARVLAIRRKYLVPLLELKRESINSDLAYIEDAALKDSMITFRAALGRLTILMQQ